MRVFESCLVVIGIVLHMGKYGSLITIDTFGMLDSRSSVA
jgi:hypothetical protein